MIDPDKIKTYREKINERRKNIGDDTPWKEARDAFEELDFFESIFDHLEGRSKDVPPTPPAKPAIKKRFL